MKIRVLRLTFETLNCQPLKSCYSIYKVIWVHFNIKKRVCWALEFITLIRMRNLSTCLFRVFGAFRWKTELTEIPRYFEPISSQISLNILVLETLNGEELVSYVDSVAENSFGDESNGDRPTFLLTVRSPEERIASAWLESPIEPPGFETQNSRKRFPLYTNPSIDPTVPDGWPGARDRIICNS